MILPRRWYGTRSAIHAKASAAIVPPANPAAIRANMKYP